MTFHYYLYAGNTNNERPRIPKNIRVLNIKLSVIGCLGTSVCEVPAHDMDYV